MFGVETGESPYLVSWNLTTPSIKYRKYQKNVGIIRCFPDNTLFLLVLKNLGIIIADEKMG